MIKIQEILTFCHLNSNVPSLTEWQDHGIFNERNFLIFSKTFEFLQFLRIKVSSVSYLLHNVKIISNQCISFQKT